MSQENELPLRWLAGIIVTLFLVYWALTSCLEKVSREDCERKQGTLVETTTTKGRAWTCLPR
jgi:hypothetical protein